MSGNVSNDEQLENISFIFITLLVFQFEISGKEIKDEHSIGIISSTLLIFSNLSLKKKYS